MEPKPAQIIQAEKIIIPGLRVEKPDRGQVVEIGNLEMVEPNITVWEAISKGTAGTEPQQLMDALYLNDVRVEEDGTLVVIDRCSLNGVWVVPQPFMQENAGDPDFWEKFLPQIILAGSVERFEITGMTIKPEEDEESTVYLDHVTLSDVDGGVIGSLLVKGLSMEDAEENVKVDLDTIRLEKADFSELLALIIQNPDLDPEEQSAQIIDSLAFNVFEIEGLNVKGDTTASMDYLAFRGFGDRKLSSIDLREFSLNDEKEDTDIHVESIKGRSFDYANLLEVMASEEEVTADKGFPISWELFSVNNITVKTPKGDNVFVREVTTSDVKYDSIIPVSISVSVQGLEVDTATMSDAKSKQTLTMLGYDKLYLGFKLEYAWSAATKEIMIKELSVGAEDAGKLAISLVLAGADFSNVQTKEDLNALAPQIALKRAEIRYTDESLAGKLLEFTAKTQNISPDDLRKQLIATIKQQPMFDFNSPETAPAAAALETFINDPQKLAIIAEPKTPAPIMAVGMQAQTAPDALSETLNLGLVVNNAPPVPLKLIKKGQ